MASSDDSLRKRPGLDRILSYFLAARKSLSAVEHLHRANEIVATARTSVETVVALRAKVKFLTDNAARELASLRSLRKDSEAIDTDGQQEFHNVLRKLDSADARVQRSVRQLKATIVEQSFNPAETTTKNLHDFVDEHGVEGISVAIRACIDQVNEAQAEFDDSNEAFDAEIKAVERALPSTYTDDAADEELSASVFHALEEQAAELAEFVQSLVKHYDLCVTALKHTEGGSEMVEQAHADDLQGHAPELLQDVEPAEQLSQEEYNEMLTVVQQDAAELEYVTQDIQTLAAGMESNAEQLDVEVNRLRRLYGSLTDAVRLLEDIGTRLALRVNSNAIYRDRWSTQKLLIEQHLVELYGIHDLYEGFLDAYDNLLVEIARRRSTHLKMDKVMQDALDKVEKMRDKEIERRTAFRDEHGEFLPSDIWFGVNEQPARFDVTKADANLSELPVISEEVLAKAVTRSRKKLPRS
ncbi:hypothetical protein MRB53_039292 [Persea americana]|nr:hypothetical protein MRB53_039292 [Persea americana]